MATPASNKPRPQRKDASNKLDSAAQKMGIKDGKTAMNMMGQGKAYDNYYNPSRVAKPLASPAVKPKIPKNRSTVEKIGGAIKGALDGAIDAGAPRKNSSGNTVINVNPLAPVMGAINGGIAGYRGKPSVAPQPKVAPDRSGDPRRSTGSGPSMNKAMPAPRNYGGITAQPMPYYPGKTPGKVENMPYTPPKDGSGPKIENMPFKPTTPKQITPPTRPKTPSPKPVPKMIPVPKKEPKDIP